jgi:hypothetical protein
LPGPLKPRTLKPRSPLEAARTADVAKVEAAGRRCGEGGSKTAETAKAADSGKAQGLIDKAERPVAEGKFSDASSVLQQLAEETLSSDQAKLVDGMKQQIQKALAAKATENATGTVGNLLKK